MSTPTEQAGATRRPNVLLVLIDDMGFGASSAFGGPCRMPTAEKLAADGLSFSRFHVTAMCSPTRAALLTGRNHHTVGMGSIAETATDAPGYSGIRPAATATIAQILKGEGYATGAFGKMHQTPPWETSPTGPFDRWPVGDGFDEFYGFLGAEANQFSPSLIHNTTSVELPDDPEEDYHLSEDLVDRAIAWTGNVEALDPDHPWFCYLSYGATHSPFHVPVSWRDRYRDEFAAGWNVQREKTLANQKRLGVVPADTELTAWADGVPEWDDLNAMEREVAERLMEMYAAFAEHTDAQTGRMLDALRERDQLDNTLIFYILGDNGASAEGGLSGTLNEALYPNGLVDSFAHVHENLDKIGGPETYAHYPVGWALAMNTPYQYAKQVASHYGGTRVGMIVHWPGQIADPGNIRAQWHHCIDIVPTILEATQITAPEVVNGVVQSPIEGTSLLYAIDDGDAAERHTTQYFEMYCNRGIYQDGWTAVTRHRVPWLEGQTDIPALDDDRWELYDTSTDWSQAVDLAADKPQRLAELKQRFEAEAAAHQVLPLDERVVERLNPALAGRQDFMAGRTSIVLPLGMPGLKEDIAPNLKNTSFSITARISSADSSDGGVLVAQGGRFGGWSLYVKDAQLNFCYNFLDLGREYVRAPLPPLSGAFELGVQFAYAGGGTGNGGTITLTADGNEIGAGDLTRTVPLKFSYDETLDIGRDRGTPVTEEYVEGVGNAFTGSLKDVRIVLNGTHDAPTREAQIRAALAVH